MLFNDLIYRDGEMVFVAVMRELSNESGGRNVCSVQIVCYSSNLTMFSITIVINSMSLGKVVSSSIL